MTEYKRDKPSRCDDTNDSAYYSEGCWTVEHHLAEALQIIDNKEKEVWDTSK